MICITSDVSNGYVHMWLFLQSSLASHFAGMMRLNGLREILQVTPCSAILPPPPSRHHHHHHATITTITPPSPPSRHHHHHTLALTPPPHTITPSPPLLRCWKPVAASGVILSLHLLQVGVRCSLNPCHRVSLEVMCARVVKKFC